MTVYWLVTAALVSTAAFIAYAVGFKQGMYASEQMARIARRVTHDVLERE